MAHLQRDMIGRLLSAQIGNKLASKNPRPLRQIPRCSTTPVARSYHQSSPIQDKVPSPTASRSPRPQQGKKGESSLWQTGKRKETRNRISTLALDPGTITEEEKSDIRGESHQGQESGFEGEARQKKPEDRLLSRNQRRLLLVSTILLLPVIGRDILEVIVPGVLGTIIFVGGKVKSGMRWVRRIGSGEGV